MTLEEYARLADDGCPNCPEHVPECEPVNFVSLNLHRYRMFRWRLVSLRWIWGSVSK